MKEWLGVRCIPVRIAPVHRLAPILVVLLACSCKKEVEEEVTLDLGPAVSALRAGDLDVAVQAFQIANTQNPSHVDAAIGASYGYLVAGDYAQADRVLEIAEETARERRGEIQLRRGLLALESGDLEAMVQHIQELRHPAAVLLLAEYRLTDGDQAGAVDLLNQLRSQEGPYGDLAKNYLDLITDNNPIVAGLAENYALWALGKKGPAVRSVSALLLSVPADQEGRSEDLLLWAGRAATSGEAEVARNLLDGVTEVSEEHLWRVEATRAIALCAEGQATECREMLEALEETAPADGLAHAKATAAGLLGNESDRAVAEALLGEDVSSAAARVALQVGNSELARKLAPSGLLSAYIEESQ